MKLYELFIGFRYLRAKKRSGFISFNTLLSVLIVFIGVFILIVVISVMNGFQAQIKDKILDIDSHITVEVGYGSALIRNYLEITKNISEIDGVKSANPFLQGHGLLRFRSSIIYFMIRGMGLPNEPTEDVAKFITEGLESYTRETGVFLGSEMAFSNGIRKGDIVEIIVPKGRLDAVDGMAPGLRKYKVLGFFKTGYYDFDTKLILMSLTDAQKLFEVGNVASGIGVKIDNVYSGMNNIALKIQSELGYKYITTTAEEKNQNLFYALKLEKLIMTIILFLVVLSAGFTIMGTLVMVVMDKRKAVGILKSMGAKPSSIMLIFVLEGFLIGFCGTLLGVLGGLAVSLNLEAIIITIENKINIIMEWAYTVFDLGVFYKISIVPTHVYYIDSIPTLVVPQFVVFIAVFAVFLSTVAAVFPAWQASRQNPIETIRYE